MANQMLRRDASHFFFFDFLPCFESELLLYFGCFCTCGSECLYLASAIGNRNEGLSQKFSLVAGSNMVAHVQYFSLVSPFYFYLTIVYQFGNSGMRVFSSFERIKWNQTEYNLIEWRTPSLSMHSPGNT